MKVWTVVNQKGGVGKTTTTVSAAGSLSVLGYKTLLIDLDPQASLTHYLGIDSDKVEANMYDLFLLNSKHQQFQAVVDQALQKTSIKQVDVLPAHMALATLDRTLGEQAGKGLIVKKIVQKLAQKYDYVVIDCPPVLGVLMVNALVAADTILLPTQTEHLALHGLDKMISTINLMRSSLSEQVKYWVVPTLFDRRLKACLLAFTKMREQYKNNLWRGYIPTDTKFRDASAAGLPINQVAPNAKGSFAYEKLVNELIRHE